MLHGIYNGKKWPPLPEYDKRKYPVAFVHYDLVNTLFSGNTTAVLTVCENSGRITPERGMVLVFDKPTEYLSFTAPYNYTEGDVWTPTSEEAKETEAIDASCASWITEENCSVYRSIKNGHNGAVYCIPVWTSHDLKDSSGAVYLPTSEPVLGGSYSKSDVTYDYFYYNGALLSDINNKWTDKTTYPYTVLLRYSTDYVLLMSTKEMYVQLYSDGGLALATRTESGSIDTSGTINAKLFRSYPTHWSNTDLYDSNNNLYIRGTPASEFDEESFKYGLSVGLSLKGWCHD